MIQGKGNEQEKFQAFTAMGSSTACIQRDNELMTPASETYTYNPDSAMGVHPGSRVKLNRFQQQD